MAHPEGKRKSDELAQRAIARGYRSTHHKNPDNDPAKITTSFSVIMDRLPDLFEKQGKIYRLKQ